MGWEKNKKPRASSPPEALAFATSAFALRAASAPAASGLMCSAAMRSVTRPRTRDASICACGDRRGARTLSEAEAGE